MKACTNSPSEGSVGCEAAMNMIKQNETAKAYPCVLRAGITVSYKATKIERDEYKEYNIFKG